MQNANGLRQHLTDALGRVEQCVIEHAIEKCHMRLDACILAKKDILNIYYDINYTTTLFA